jgi:UDP-N-acetylglucosamine--N-acetylmuramyl-(pentapeptide) pyrophosphoryl-undecaprenol N-acetylglucosamine transferase
VAARREGVPFVVHEANAKPGLANVLGARGAAAVGVAFAGTPLRRGEVVGMPLRREVIALDRAASRAEAADHFGLDADRPVLLVFGGSLGAQRLNDAIAGSWRDILDAGWQLLHVTGERSDLADPGVPGYALRRYVDRMDLAFALADLIVSRSGSATVSEISALGIPALYVPYSVGNGEQRLNAASAVAAGAAELLDDATFDADAVRRAVVPLLGDPARISRMAAAAEGVGTRTGTENVIALVDRALGAA